jgi:hypothetical protein
MNCEQMEEQLSAYIDQEVDAVECRDIERHVGTCAHCRAMIDEYRALGVLVRRSEPLVDTDALWSRISEKLEMPKVRASSMDSLVKRWTKQWGFSILAAAASVAFLSFALRYSGTEEHDGSNPSHRHASLSVDFAEVFHSAKREPKQAIAKLVSKYEGRELSEQETKTYLGYEPALFKGVPEGFTRVSTHVLNMPCCKCSATICERRDGSSIIVFEHRDEQPVWFGDLPTIETMCAGKSCKIVESAGQLAVSWKNQDRQLTMIGAKDLAEVNEWVTSLQL